MQADRHKLVKNDAASRLNSRTRGIGHVGPEAWVGGPIGRVRDGDAIRLRIDTRALEGSADIIDPFPRAGSPVAAPRPAARYSRVPADTRLRAAVQKASDRTCGGRVYDTDQIAGLVETALAEPQCGDAV